MAHKLVRGDDGSLSLERFERLTPDRLIAPKYAYEEEGYSFRTFLLHLFVVAGLCGTFYLAARILGEVIDWLAP
jgi:hypothetical protein